MFFFSPLSEACVKMYFPLPFSRSHFLLHCGFSHFFDLLRPYLIFIIKRLREKKTFFHVFYFLALAGHLFFSCGLCYLCRLLFDTHTREYGVGRRKSEGNMEKVPVNRSWFVFSMRMRPSLVWELQISAAQSHCGTSSTVRDLLENFNLEYLYDGWRKKELIFSDEYSFKETVRIWATYLLQMFCFTCKKKRWEFSVTLHYITFS